MHPARGTTGEMGRDVLVACFSKPLPYLWPNYAIFPALYNYETPFDLTLKSNPCSKPVLQLR